MRRCNAMLVMLCFLVELATISFTLAIGFWPFFSYLAFLLANLVFLIVLGFRKDQVSFAEGNSFYPAFLFIPVLIQLLIGLHPVFLMADDYLRLLNLASFITGHYAGYDASIVTIFLSSIYAFIHFLILLSLRTSMWHFSQDWEQSVHGLIYSYKIFIPASFLLFALNFFIGKPSYFYKEGYKEYDFSMGMYVVLSFVLFSIGYFLFVSIYRKKMTANDIVQKEALQKKIDEYESRIKKIGTPTKQIKLAKYEEWDFSNQILFFDEQQMMICLGHDLYYDAIQSYDINDGFYQKKHLIQSGVKERYVTNHTSTADGLTRATLGGLLWGAKGAVLAGMTAKTQSVVHSVYNYEKVYTDHYNYQVIITYKDAEQDFSLKIEFGEDKELMLLFAEKLEEVMSHSQMPVGN